jgi:AsmA protein
LGTDWMSLMGSLDGAVSVRMERGALIGRDIPAMVRDLDDASVGAGHATPFERLQGSAKVTDGVARGDDLRLSMPSLEASGAGLVDIGAGEVAGRIVTVAPDGSQVPILIDGPWGAPTIRPDLEWVARRELALRARAEAAKIEARVQAEAEAAARRADRAAREKLAAELGVTVDALGSREAIEAAIRETVGAQLLDALEQR